MNKKIMRASAVAMACAGMLTFNSCVDEDYDLSNDVDMLVQIGGQMLSLPASNTLPLTLGDVLDLDGSIRSVDAADAAKYGLSVGDYALIQDGDSRPATYVVDPVELNVNGVHHDETVTFPEYNPIIDPYVSRFALIIGNAKLPADFFPVSIPSQFEELANRVIQNMGEFSNSISLHEGNVTTELKSLNHAVTELDMNIVLAFNFTNYSKNVTIGKGFSIEFGQKVGGRPQFEISSGDPAVTNAAGIAFTDNMITFTKDYDIPAMGMKLPISIKGINCVRADGKPVLAIVDGKNQFDFESTIRTNGILYLAKPSSTSPITMQVSTDIGGIHGTQINGKVLAVTGVVTPDIVIDPVDFEINDVPDYLREDDNSLDIANPRINVNVSNNSPLELAFSGKLVGHYDDGKPDVVAYIGYSNGAPDESIHIKRGGADGASVTTHIVFSRVAIAGMEGNVVIPALGDILATIPDRIEFIDIYCRAIEQEATFILGTDYNFQADYEAVVPLAFGSNMRLCYEDEVTDWDTDLSKFNFSEAQLAFKVISTVPLQLEPEFTALSSELDNEGNHLELSSVKAIVAGPILAGTPEAPATSNVVVTLKSNGQSIKNLDGLRMKFSASVGQAAGVNINANQTLQINDIIFRLINGVTFDLNDLIDDDNDDNDND